MSLNELINIKYLLAAVVYSGVGILVLTVAFLILDLLTPRFAIWKELIEKQNIAFAIFLAGITMGISLIIASAIHG